MVKIHGAGSDILLTVLCLENKSIIHSLKMSILRSTTIITFSEICDGTDVHGKHI